MKATGIVRKIDELGRVVIPKEIRRTLRIKEGDPLEIFTNRDGEVIFKKYSPLNELESMAKSCAQALADAVGHITIVCDKDSVLAAVGTVRDGYTNKPISEKLEGILDRGQRIVLNVEDTTEMIPVKIDDGVDDYVAQVICPVKSGGSIIGGIIVASQRPGVVFTQKEAELCEMAATMLSHYVS